jgi:hypothetical protein
MEARTEKAQRRFAVWQWQAALPSHLNRQQRFVALQQAHAAGRLPFPPIAQSTFYATVQKGERARAQGRVPDMTDFLDAPRTGRPPRDLDPRLRDVVVGPLRVGQPLPNRRLLALARAEATRLKRAGVTIHPPTRRQIDRVVADIPFVQTVAARYGPKAAVQDASLLSTIPTTRTHEVWAFDELTLPIWMRVTDLEKPGYYRAVKPSCVIVIDVHSRTILAAQIVAAMERMPDDEGARTSERHLADDVRGAVASAALTDLAPSAYRPTAGYLPERLRCDNDNTHHKMREWADTLGISMPEIPTHSPKDNGHCERLIGSLKDLCHGVLGFEGDYEPAEGAAEHPQELAARTNGTQMRVAERQLVPVANLLARRQLQRELDKAVQAYHERRHSALGRTPLEVHFESRDPTATRQGRDMLLALELKNVRATREGIPLGQTRFFPRDARAGIQVNDEIAIRVDPLRRGCFVQRPEGEWVYCPRKDIAARQLDAAAFVQARAATAHASAVAGRAEKLTALAQQIGAAALQQADQLQQQAAAAAKTKRKAKDQARRAQAKAAIAETGVSAKPRPQGRAPAPPPRREALAPKFTSLATLPKVG